jgi:hypothetical protein
MIGVNLEGGDLAGLRSVQCSAPVVDMIEHQPMQLQGPYVVVGQDECMHVILPRLHPDVRLVGTNKPLLHACTLHYMIVQTWHHASLMPPA